ncbi:MAG: biotin transporter BioY [Devosia sp.]|uniref:biotin transporter BioY n=1 Tax=Devosia sp. TaxID=1871048 RepID=UPI0026351729|nr:biotin transporter BioY [Devosia sp.]MDB5528951.1 biotin transporter BioY [Devosia sp.]
MAVTLTTPNTLLGTFQPKSDAAKLAMGLVTVVLGTALLTVAAKINVPVWPVHITLQSMVVAALAAAFGARIGVATVMLYLVEGLSGLPVFSTGGGFGYIMSPSFGFIIGWLPMAYIIGMAADRGAAKRPLTMFATMLVADAVSFAFGFAWLMVVANLITQGGGALPAWLSGGNLLTVAFDGAIKPFIIWDVLKMAFAALTVTGAWSLFGAKR